jgi:hypothetical protein
MTGLSSPTAGFRLNCASPTASGDSKGGRIPWLPGKKQGTSFNFGRFRETAPKTSMILGSSEKIACPGEQGFFSAEQGIKVSC